MDVLKGGGCVGAAQPPVPTVLCLNSHLRRLLSKTDDSGAPGRHIWRRSGDGVGGRCPEGGVQREEVRLERGDKE